jgi:uncharacterized membrane protein YoaT (DUF817 family)
VIVRFLPGRDGPVHQLGRFVYAEVMSCAFAAAVFAGLLLSKVVPLPIPRYDAMLLWCLAVTFGFWLLRLETGREVAVIGAFHLVGLAMELYKVKAGSWSYPGDAYTKIGGVPLYSGFMYAAVGSYVCQAWRRFDLRVTGYRAWTTAVVAVAVYANFFTHHVIPDLRLPLALVLLFVLRRAMVHFTVGDRRYRMPLALSFVCIGFALYAAENGATFLGAWAYPDQESVWTLVHPGKFGSWSLLVVVSFVLVAAVKAYEGRLYGHRQDAPTVVGPAPRTVAAELPDADPVATAPKGRTTRRRA